MRYTIREHKYDTDTPMARLQELENKIDDGELLEVVTCKNCKYLEFSDCYGECSKGFKGVVSPNTYCGNGERKE